MYRTITRFLLKQPFIDLVHIPLFGELFHSTSGEVRVAVLSSFESHVGVRLVQVRTWLDPESAQTRHQRLD